MTSKAKDVIISAVNGMNEVAKFCKDEGLTDIASLGITNQRESFAVWHDDENGNPRLLEDIISWQAFHCLLFPESLKWPKDLKEQSDREDKLRRRISNITGLPHTEYFSAAKMHQFLVEENGNLQPDFKMGTVDCLLLRMLTGEFKTDLTNAHRTNLVDIRNSYWSSEILDLWNINKSNLPLICPSANVFGSVYSDLSKVIYTEYHLDPFFSGVQVSALIGDQQSSSLAHGLAQTSSVKLTLGTGAFLSSRIHNIEAAMNFSQELTTREDLPQEALIQITPLVSYAVSKYLPEGRTLHMAENYCKMAGGGIGTMVKHKLLSSHTEFDTLCALEAGELKINPTEIEELADMFFMGDEEAASFKMKRAILSPEEKGAICRAYLGRVVESIVTNVNVFGEIYKRDASHLDQDGKRHHSGEFDCIYVDGGLAQSKAMQEALQSIWKDKVLFRKDPEMTVLGAAICSAVGTTNLDFEYSLSTFKRIMQNLNL